MCRFRLEGEGGLKRDRRHHRSGAVTTLGFDELVAPLGHNALGVGWVFELESGQKFPTKVEKFASAAAV